MDIGGGDLFGDMYGPKCLSWVINSRLAVLLRRKRLILCPQTIGPFNKSYRRLLAAHVARRCEKIFTRDPQSISLLSAMDADKRAESTVDVAFRLPFTPAMPNRGRVIRVGLNVSGMLYGAAVTGTFSFHLKVDYPALIDRIVTTLRCRSDISIVLVPHVFGSAQLDDDLWICKKLAEKFELELAPQFKSPIEAKSFISALDILAGSRMHATIAAISSGVPTIPLAYSPEFIGVFTSVNYPLVCDLKSQDVDTIVDEVVRAIDRIPELRAAAAAGNAVAQAKLDRYQEYLVNVMRTLP